MEQRTIQITLPADLVEQLEESKLLQNERFWEQLIRDELEQAQKRVKAFQEMQETFAEFDTLPDAIKPSEEEILATIKEVRAERRAIREDRP